MVVQLNISYETLLELVDQLSPEQIQALQDHLLHQADKRKLSTDERLALYHASIMSVPVKEEPSIRREDWYDDDGR